MMCPPEAEDILRHFYRNFETAPKMSDTLKFEHTSLGELKLESSCKVVAIGGDFEYEELYNANHTPTDTLNSMHKSIENKIGEILNANSGPIIVALPELYGSQKLDKFIEEKLQSYQGKAVIIAGSYYVEEKGKKRNRATIHVKIGDKEYIQKTQYKRLYSREEKDVFRIEDAIEKPQIIFENTGFGDFSVIICSDLDSRQPPDFDTILDRFTNKIDIAFVIAFNKGVGPHGRACKKAGDIYNYLVYINGRKHDSSKKKE